MPPTLVASAAEDQGHASARPTAGVTATTAAHALSSSAMYGRTPSSGSATLSAAKIEITKKTPPSHGRGCTRAAYHGSNVARTTRTTSSATNTTLTDVNVAAA